MHKTIEILYGLPGSGKTTYALSETKGGDKYLINADFVAPCKITLDCLAAQITETITNPKINWVIVDGLFTTNLNIDCLMSKIDIYNDGRYDITYQITWWEENRSACLLNDAGRRKISSRISIEHMKFEIPSKHGVVMSKKNVKSGFDRFVDRITRPGCDYILGSQTTISSESWSLGGTCGNCWDDKLDAISPEIPPDSFKNLDEILNKVAPQMTVLQYKKLYRDIVEKVSFSEADYYGGIEMLCCYKCNTKSLYDALKKMELL